MRDGDGFALAQRLSHPLEFGVVFLRLYLLALASPAFLGIGRTTLSVILDGRRRRRRRGRGRRRGGPVAVVVAVVVFRGILFVGVVFGAGRMRGFPARDLRLSVLRLRGGEGVAVVTVAVMMVVVVVVTRRVVGGGRRRRRRGG